MCADAAEQLCAVLIMLKGENDNEYQYKASEFFP
jgi:hypothetical protein